MIAFGGCFWAAPGDVMVGEFTDSMNYNPHFISIHDVIDPEYDEFDNIDFVDWENGYLNCNGDGTRLSICVDTIHEATKIII